ncbi:hypothetical protein E4L96_09485 [Massilia arenosa]|uniref:Sugar transporter n=1 Tax=Zemynaea arenosa TaxID=2561931 RepID=A0A4Y9SEJ2_9BURK|nr:hypothetical protein E4L96_09485 [Massilia arenosa]
MLHSKVFLSKNQILIVKPSLALKSAAALTLALCLAACGQTGPLYLPKPPAKPAQPPATTAIPPTTTTPPTPNQ